MVAGSEDAQSEHSRKVVDVLELVGPRPGDLVIEPGKKIPSPPAKCAKAVSANIRSDQRQTFTSKTVSCDWMQPTPSLGASIEYNEPGKRVTQSGSHNCKPDWVVLIVISGRCGCPTGNPSAALGKPPLVLTTHVITSFRKSHPGLEGVQPRARAGFGQSCHVLHDPQSARLRLPHPTHLL